MIPRTGREPGGKARRRVRSARVATCPPGEEVARFGWRSDHPDSGSRILSRASSPCSRAWSSLGVQVLARRRQPRRRASPSLPGHWRGRRQHGPEGGDAEVGRALGGGVALSAIAAPRACIGVVERFVRLLPEGGIFLVGIVIVVPGGFAWDDEGEVSALRARLRAALAERRSSASLASTAGSGFGVGFGGRFGYGATPVGRDVVVGTPLVGRARFAHRVPAYDPSAFDEYFAWRPALVLRRALEIALRLGDVGARVYVKRGDIQDRAARLRRHLTALGPAFVKLGQVLSTRADVLPASYCRELAELQDNLPPRPANTPPPS